MSELATIPTDSIGARLLAAHKLAEEKTNSAHGVVAEVVTLKAAVGRLLQESGLTPDEVAAIDPQLGRMRLHYHNAARFVASHPDQLVLPGLKLLAPVKAEEEGKDREDRSEMDEFVRKATNLARQIEILEKAWPEFSKYEAAMIRRMLKPEVDFLQRLEASSMEHHSANPNYAFEEDSSGINALVGVSDFDVDDVARRMGEFSIDVQAEIREQVGIGVTILGRLMAKHESPKLVWFLIQRALHPPKRVKEHEGKRFGLIKQSELSFEAIGAHFKVTKQAAEKAWKDINAVLGLNGGLGMQ